jgi:hypothetical protein
MLLNFSANKTRVKTIGWHLLFWLIYILYEEVLVLYAKQPAKLLGTLYSFLINAAVFYNFWQCIRYLTKKIKNIFVLISNGIGLNYIRERLTDEYGREGYELLINETHNTYECKLIMPLKYSENHAGLILKGDRNLLINQKPIYV